jgi:hypothetical protein
MLLLIDGGRLHERRLLGDAAESGEQTFSLCPPKNPVFGVENQVRCLVLIARHLLRSLLLSLSNSETFSLHSAAAEHTTLLWSRFFGVA